MGTRTQELRVHARTSRSSERHALKPDRNKETSTTRRRMCDTAHRSPGTQPSPNVGLHSEKGSSPINIFQNACDDKVVKRSVGDLLLNNREKTIATRWLPHSTFHTPMACKATASSSGAVRVNSERIMTDPVFVLTSPGGDPRGIRREHQSVGLAEQEIDRRLCNELTNELHRSPPTTRVGVRTHGRPWLCQTLIRCPFLTF
ncbi:unnamed protein product [Boreogadus saida]